MELTHLGLEASIYFHNSSEKLSQKFEIHLTFFLIRNKFKHFIFELSLIILKYIVENFTNNKNIKIPVVWLSKWVMAG